MIQRIRIIFGTRPEAIKLIPVVRALQARAGVVVQTLATGQHDLLLDQVLDLHKLRPDLHLDLIRRDDSLDALHASLLLSIGDALDLVRPDMVVVQGDTATAHAGSLAADTLVRECIDPATVLMTGNTIVDALAAVQASVAFDPALAAGARSILAAADGRLLILATAHRRENARSMHAIATALKTLARESGALVLVVRHPNAAESPAFARLLGVANLVVTDLLDHAAFVTLLDRADIVLTDSGGVQERSGRARDAGTGDTRDDQAARRRCWRARPADQPRSRRHHCRRDRYARRTARESWTMPLWRWLGRRPHRRRTDSRHSAVAKAASTLARV